MRDEAVARAARRRALVLAGLVLAPWMVDDYTVALLARTLALGLVGVSVALLTGVAGLPTLGQTAPYAAGAYACAVVGSRLSDVAWCTSSSRRRPGRRWPRLTVPLVVYARGVIVLMITLAIGELVVTVLGRWRSVTGGTDGLAGVPPVRPLWGLPALATDRARYLYALVVVAALVGAVLLILRTRVGLLLRAGRDDEARLRASGHRVSAHVAGRARGRGGDRGCRGLPAGGRPAVHLPGRLRLRHLRPPPARCGGRWRRVRGRRPGRRRVVIAVRDWLFGVLPGLRAPGAGGAFVGDRLPAARRPASAGGAGSAPPAPGRRTPRPRKAGADGGTPMTPLLSARGSVSATARWPRWTGSTCGSTTASGTR